MEPRTVLTASFVGGPITTQNTLEDVASIVQFQIADDSVPLASLTLTATSDNQTVLPNANLALTNLGGGAYQLSSLPAANQYGSGLVTLTITGDGAPVAQSFTLNVTSVNDPPSFTKGADQSILNGAGAQSISNWATSISPGPNETGQTLTFQVANDNPSLFTVAPTINSSGTLTYTPSGVLGTAVVSVVLSDGGGTADGGSDTSAAQTFTIQVAAPPAAAAGSLDPTFDGDGIRQLTSPQGASDQSREVVVQADGKILALSMTFTGGTLGLSSTTFLKRYNVDGTLDTTFAVGGTFILSDRYNLTALDVQSNGKILLAGDATIGSGIYVTRLNTDGSLDTTFGTAGVARISVNNVSSSLSERVGMTVQSDDRIIVVRGNHATPGSNMHFAVGRLTASGAVDTTFNSTGFVNVTVSASQNEFPVDAAVQSDGKIVVAGVTNLGAGAGMDFIALRFTSAGALDTSFNSVGYHVVNVSSSASGNDNANRVIVQSDGKILLGGFANADFGLVRFNTDGSLDSTFDGDGKVTTNFSGTDQIFGLLQQSDGTIIAGGTANGDFALARYTSTGALDTAFDGDGKAMFAVASNSEQINGIALQSDGKIAFAGTSTDAQNLGDVVVGRFNSNGSIDTTFNGVGYTTSGFAPGSARITSSLQLADGRVLLGGFLVELNSSAAGRRAVWRLLADGSLDTTFGTGGVSLGTSLTQSTVSSLLVQSDGKILVLDATQSRLTRLSADGAVDTSFGSSGSLTLAPTYLTIPNGASSMALLGDGKILIAGAKLNSSTSLNEFAVVRVTSAGTVDATFDSDGLVTIDVGAGADFGRMIAVQSDGKILAGGYANNGTNDDFALVRLNADGSLDTSFGGTGKVAKAVGSGTDQARALLLQSDGKIVLGGQSSSDFCLVRFLADGTVDASFGAAGVVVTQLTVGAADDLLSLVRQADGKYLAVGYATVSSVQRIAVVRYLADGALDSSFGTAGAVLTTVGANNNQGQTAYLQPDGKLVVGGFADGNSTASATMLRYVTAATPGAPSISSVADQTTLEDTTSAAINFSVSHPTLPAGSLNVTVASGNTTLVPNGQLVLENLGNGNWRLTGTPAADQYGSALITLTVSDGALSYAETFTLTVTPVNDPPSFTKGADQSSLANAGAVTVAGWATAISSGAGDPAQSLTFEVTADNPSLFAVGPAVAANGTLTYTASGLIGTAVVSVRLKDSGGIVNGGADASAWQTFTIQIKAVPVSYAAGSFDTTFATNGLFTQSTVTTQSHETAIAVQSDGKVLVAGAKNDGTTLGKVGVWRLNTDGALDTTFGSGGFASHPSFNGRVSAMLVQSDGKIVMSTTNSDRLLRFNSDGSVDTTFDGDGATFLPTFTHRIYALAMQSDGKIVAAGFSVGSGHNDVEVYRFNANGSVDTTFDGDGIALVSFSGTTNNFARTVAVQSDGKIVVAGYMGSAANGGSTIIARLNSNGSLDSTFDGDGMLNVALSSFEIINSVAIQSDGKIVVAGGVNFMSPTTNKFLVARFNSDGTADNSFSADGKTTVFTGFAAQVFVDSQGRIILVGADDYSSAGNPAIVRLLANGTPDSSFDGDGLATAVASAGLDMVYDAAVTPAGDYVLSGMSNSAGQLFALRFRGGSGSYVSAPSIAAVGDQATNEDVAKVVDFTVSHTTLPVNSVSITATSDNQTLIPNAGLALANLGGGNWRLTATPAANLSGSALVTLTASDGTNSYAETFTLTVDAVNDAPVVDLNGVVSGTGCAASFTEDSGPVAIVDSASLSLVDVDSATLAGATVTITNLLDGAAETLTANVAGTSLSAVYLNGVLAISGVGTVAEYQQVLRTVLYNNSSQAPTAIPRQVAFTVTDGAATSPAATSVVSIVPTNDAPTAGVNLGLALAEGATAVVDGTRLKSNDVDNTSAQLVYTVTNLPAHGTVNLNGAALLANGTFTQADLDAGRVTYTHDSSESINDAFSFAASDGQYALPAASFNITITPVNDAPTAAVNLGLTLAEGATVVIDGTRLKTNDVDNASAQLVYTVTNLPAHGMLNLNGTALTAGGTFTQADLDAGRVGYTHDSSENFTDQFQFTVTDGEHALSEATFALVITPVNDAPVLTTSAGLTLNEGATATIGNALLKSMDIDSTAAQLVYTVLTTPMHGTLLKNGVALNSGETFTQTDIDADKLTYTHDGSEPTSDGVTAYFNNFDGSGALLGGVTAGFSGVTNTEGVQGYAGLGTGANVFSGDFLRNMSGGAEQAPGSVTPIKSTLTLTGLPSHESIDLNFLLAIINSWDGNHVRGGGNLAGFDVFNVTVDGVAVLSDYFANFTSSEQTYAPPTGVQLTSRPFSDLGFPDPESFPDAAYNMGLDPRFDNIAHTSSTVTIEWFASGPGWQGGSDESWAIDNVEVKLNGVASVATNDSFTFTVSDGADGTIGSTDFVISVNAVDDAPTAGANLGLTLAEGGTAVITSGLLQTNDVDNTAAQLIYTVTNLPTHGTVNLNGAALAANGTFTQADLDAGRVGYTHDSSENFADNFKFTVSDGGFTLPEATFALTIAPVNDAPAAGANLGLTLAEGAAAVLDGTRLKSNDVDNTTAQLVYTVTNLPARGTLNLNGAGLAAGGTFTQADLDAGRVGYTHDSSENFTDSFKFTVTDGEYFLAEATFALTITPVNDAPTAGANQGLTLAEGGTGVVGGNLLRTDDVDNSSGQRTYTLTAVTAHGALAGNGVALAIGGTFTQADLDAGLIRYTHDSSENFADGFKFTVSDGGFTLPEATFALAITPVNDAPTAGANLGLTLAEGATVVLDGTRLKTNDVDDTTAQLVYAVTNLPAHGTVNLNGAALAADGTFTQADLDAGRVTYTHDSSENFSDELKFTVADGEYALPEARFALTIAPVNDAPTVGVNSGLTLAEGAAAVVTGGMLRTDDVDNVTAQRTYALIAATTHGVLARNGAALAAGGTFTQADLDAGRVTYTHDSSENFSDAFSFTVSDGQYTLPVAAFNIAITPVNDAPTAGANLGPTLAEGSTVDVTGGLLQTNDVDSSAAQLVYAVTSLPTYGTLNLNGTALGANGAFTQADLDAGRISYTHDSSENFADSFKFTVSDGQYALTEATFALTITPVNDAPTAGANLGLTLAEGATVVLDGTRLRTNDVDNSAAQLVYVVTSLPSHGTVNLNGTALVANGAFTQADLDAGRVTYTHDSSENFADNFKFTISDGQYSLNEATFALAITPVNDAPTAGANLGLTLAEGTTATIGGGLLQTNDVDSSAAQLVYTVTNLPAYGTLNLNGTALGANGTFTQADLDAGRVSYTHDSSENFTDNFQFTVTDGEFRLTSAAFALVITPVNDAPTAGASLGLTLAEGGTATIGGGLLKTNDVDNSSAQLVYTVTNLPAHGTVNLNGAALTANGTFTQADLDAGRVTYTHDSSENFTDDFKFTVTDGQYALTQATFALTITPVNDAPTAGVNLGLTLAEGATAVVNGGLLQTHDVDDTAAQLIYTVVSPPTHGTLNLNGAALAADGMFTQADLDAGNVTYTHDSSENFSDQFQFIVADGEYSLSESAFSLTITPVNDAPTAGANLGLTLAEGATVVLDGTRLKTNDVDNTSAQLVYTVTNLPAHGTVNLNGAALAANGAFTQADLDAGRVGYTHDSSENFTDQFQFTVTDGEYSLTSATFALNITRVNDAPTAGVNLGLTLAEGGTATIAGGLLQTNDVDNSAAELVYTVTNLPAHGTVNLNGAALAAGGMFTQADLDAGNVTYTHDSSENFTDSFMFTVADGEYALSEATFALVITPVNDAPVVAPQNFILYNKAVAGTIVGAVQAADRDAGQQRSFAIVGGNGALAINAATGVLTVVNSKLLVGTALNFAVRVTDDGVPPLATDAPISVSLRAADAPPTFAVVDGASAPLAVVNNQVKLTLDERTDVTATRNGLVIATLAAADVDEPGVVFPLTMTDKSGAFAFDAATGKLSIRDDAKLDYEKTRSFTLTFKATDHGLVGLPKPVTSTLTMTVQLTDRNDAPTVAPAATFKLKENNGAKVTVGTVKAADADGPAAFKNLQYAIVSQRDAAGDDVGIFSIDAARGTLMIAAAGALNYEARPQYTVVVRARDAAGLFADQTVTVQVIDVNEAVVLALLDAAQNPTTGLTVPENTVNGTLVGYLRIDNPDVTRPETFKITLGDNLGKAFAVGAFDAVSRLAPITVFNVTKLNFEAIRNGQFTLSFTVSDSGFTSNDGSKFGGVTVNKTYNSLVADVNEAPTAVAWKTVGLPSGAAPIPAGTLFGTALGVDPDKTPQAFTYSLPSATLNNDLFTIDPLTGQLRSSLALGRKGIFSLLIRVTDAGGLFFNQSVVIKT